MVERVERVDSVEKVDSVDNADNGGCRSVSFLSINRVIGSCTDGSWSRMQRSFFLQSRLVSRFGMLNRDQLALCCKGRG